MAEATLLSMVQNILSRLSSDEVNSITDTTESMQVATIIQNKFFDITSRADLPKHDQVFQLSPSGTNLLPTLMYMPTGFSSLKWLKYFNSNVLDTTSTSSTHGINTDIISTVSWITTSTTSQTVGTGNKTFTVASSSLPVTVGQGVIVTSGTSSMFGNVVTNGYVGTSLTINIVSTIGSGTFASWVIQTSASNAVPGYQYVNVVPLQQFLDQTNRFNPSESNVKSMVFTEGGYNFTFYYKTDHTPSYCTVLSNFYVLFDQFDNTQDTTLQGVKTLAYGQSVPIFTMADSFVPALDDQQFPLLLNESTALAFYELRQMPHAKAEQEIKRQWSTVAKNKSMSGKPTAFNALADFGRVPRTGGYAGYPIYRWMRENG